MQGSGKKRQTKRAPKRVDRKRDTRTLGDDVPSDDSADEDYSSSDSTKGRKKVEPRKGKGAARRVASRGEIAPGSAAAAGATRSRDKRKAVGSHASLTGLPPETLLRHIILPHLSQLDKLRLHMACSATRRLLEAPEAWTELDVSLAVVGITKSLRTGRVSKLTPLPAYMRCKDVLQQKRFSNITAANLSRLMLGTASNPDLLAELFARCPKVTSLDITNATADRSPYAYGVLERFLATNAPQLQRLRITVHSGSNATPVMLLQECKQLKRLALNVLPGQQLSIPESLASAQAPCLEELEISAAISPPKQFLKCLQVSGGHREIAVTHCSTD
ncbi:hypothetical protein JKP88DRAFT_268513 [Tribonema minus]|uniref:F-box domain-containing protein n=1 Tax=Tribonema minus TaxID=303371 RepID=A0A835YZJ4_9STRA|nr:hypothetical protein JKP88DRAFT_268513 [Tribonema minus]